MKFTLIMLPIAALACSLYLTGCNKTGAEAEAKAAFARGEYQFIALLDADGKWSYPKFPEIPDWYFESTGIRMRQTKPETLAADSACMSKYNDVLYQALKTNGKFQVIEDSIAKIKANLDKAKK